MMLWQRQSIFSIYLENSMKNTKNLNYHFFLAHSHLITGIYFYFYPLLLLFPLPLLLLRWYCRTDQRSTHAPLIRIIPPHGFWLCCSGASRIGCHSGRHRRNIRFLLCPTPTQPQQKATRRPHHPIPADASTNGRSLAQRTTAALFQKIAIADSTETVARLIAHTTRIVAAAIAIVSESQVLGGKRNHNQSYWWCEGDRFG